MSKVMKKILVALDFDHTIINDNSDTYIYKLAPNGVIPRELKKLYSESGWTKYMGEVFKYLHSNGVDGSDILKCLDEIELTDGMEKLFKSLPEDLAEFIIISDSNTIFINHILKSKQLKNRISAVFSNYAEFLSNGCLSIEMYHCQNFCDLSTINLCKGDILAKYISVRALHGVEFPKIAYVGDGFNDFCPSLRLNNSDAVFYRVGFRLEKTIASMEKDRNLKLEASVYPWKSANEILKVVESWCSSIQNSSAPRPRLCNPLT